MKTEKNNNDLDYKHSLNKYAQLNTTILTLHTSFKRSLENANTYLNDINELIDYLPFFPELGELAKNEIELIFNNTGTSFNTQLNHNTKETVHYLATILKNSENIKNTLKEISNKHPSFFSSVEYLHTESTLKELLEKVSIKNLEQNDDRIRNISLSLEAINKELIPLFLTDLLDECNSIKKYLNDTINNCLHHLTVPDVDISILKDILIKIIEEHQLYSRLENEIVCNSYKILVKEKYSSLIIMNKKTIVKDDLSKVLETYKYNNKWLRIFISEYNECISCEKLSKYTSIKNDLLLEIESRYDNPNYLGKLNKLNLLKVINDAEFVYQDFIVIYDSISEDEKKQLGSNYNKLERLRYFDYTKLDVEALNSIITVIKYNVSYLLNIKNKVGIMNNFIAEKDLYYNDTPIAKGGEGLIFKIDSNNGTCYKKYHNHVDIFDKKDKLAYMLMFKYESFQGEYFSICWPYNLVFHNEQFTGFVMKMAHPEALSLYELVQPSFRDKLRLNQGWSSRYARDNYNGFVNRVKLCANLALAVHHIHEKGNAVIVDLKPQNILFQSNGYIYVTDCDSFQITSDDGTVYRAKVATPEYAPPESGIAPDTNLCIDHNWDNFSLAVIIYEVLFGIHPYVANYGGIYNEYNTVRQKIVNNLFVHNVERKYVSFIPDQHSLYQLLPKELILLFNKAFSSTNRPEPKDWRIALGSFISEESNKNVINAIVNRTTEINNNTENKKSKSRSSPTYIKSHNISSYSDATNGLNVLYVFVVILIFVLIIAFAVTR